MIMHFNIIFENQLTTINGKPDNSFKLNRVLR